MRWEDRRRDWDVHALWTPLVGCGSPWPAGINHQLCSRRPWPPVPLTFHRVITNSFVFRSRTHCLWFSYHLPTVWQMVKNLLLSCLQIDQFRCDLCFLIELGFTLDLWEHCCSVNEGCWSSKLGPRNRERWWEAVVPEVLTQGPHGKRSQMIFILNLAIREWMWHWV